MNRCLLCRYYSANTDTCDHLLMTGVRRGCPAGDCTRFAEADELFPGLSAEERAALYTAYYMGMNDSESAEAAGVSRFAAARWRKALGLSPNSGEDDEEDF